MVRSSREGRGLIRQHYFQIDSIVSNASWRETPSNECNLEPQSLVHHKEGQIGQVVAGEDRETVEVVDREAREERS